MGYDVHRLVEGRDLIIGGVKIPYEKGLLGHSDADVLLHAIMDALLGAAALGDIGKHFPDTDPAYKGISSIKLLEKVGELLEENHAPAYRYHAGKYRESPADRCGTGQCEGYHGGRTGIHRQRRGNLLSGNLSGDYAV